MSAPRITLRPRDTEYKTIQRIMKHGQHRSINEAVLHVVVLHEVLVKKHTELKKEHERTVKDLEGMRKQMDRFVNLLEQNERASKEMVKKVKAITK